MTSAMSMACDVFEETVLHKQQAYTSWPNKCCELSCAVPLEDRKCSSYIWLPTQETILSQKLRRIIMEHFVFLEYFMACLYSILSNFCLSLNSSDLQKEDLDEETHILRPRLDSNGIRMKFNEKRRYMNFVHNLGIILSVQMCWLGRSVQMCWLGRMLFNNFDKFFLVRKLWPFSFNVIEVQDFCKLNYFTRLCYDLKQAFLPSLGGAESLRYDHECICDLLNNRDLFRWY